MIEKGRIHEVQDELNFLLKKEPYNEDATYLSSQAYLLENKPYFALNKFDKFLEKYPSSEAMTIGKFRALITFRKYDKALTLYQNCSNPSHLFQFYQFLSEMMLGTICSEEEFKSIISKIFIPKRNEQYKFNLPNCSEKVAIEIFNQKIKIKDASKSLNKKSIIKLIFDHLKKSFDDYLNLRIFDIFQLKQFPQNEFLTNCLEFDILLEDAMNLRELARIDPKQDIEKYKQYYVERVIEMSKRYDQKVIHNTSDWPGQKEYVLVSPRWFKFENENFDSLDDPSQDHEKIAFKLFHRIKDFTNNKMLVCFCTILNEVCQNSNKQKILLHKDSQNIERFDRHRVIIGINSLFKTNFKMDMLFSEKLAFLDLEKIKNYILKFDSKKKNTETGLKEIYKIVCELGLEDDSNGIDKKVEYDNLILTNSKTHKIENPVKGEQIGTSSHIQTVFETIEGYEIELAADTSLFCSGKTFVCVNFTEYNDRRYKFIFANKIVKFRISPPIEITEKMKFDGLKFDLRFEQSGCMRKPKKSKGVFFFNSDSVGFLDSQLKQKKLGWIDIKYIKLNIK